MRFFIAFSTLLLAPSLVFAAGFAPQSIFLSQSPVTEGDSVRIYAIVTNESSVQFAGKVVLKEGDTEIGSQAVSLAAGATETASVPWTPVAGSHTVIADLVSTDGSVAEEKSETFDVLAKPQPQVPDTSTNQAQGAVESSQSIQNSIAQVSPQAATAVAPVFNFVDSLRGDAAGVINTQLAATQPKVTTTSLTSGTAPTTTSWLTSIFYTIYFYILTLLGFIIGSAGVFYPLVALLLLYFLWRMFRRFRRA